MSSILERKLRFASARFYGALAAATVSVCACAAGGAGPELDEPADRTADESFASALESTSPEAAAVLSLVNDVAVNAIELDDDAGLDRRAAYNIVGRRNGADGAPGTGDDALFADLSALDSVPWVGPVALERLLDYARVAGYLDAQRARSLDVIFSPQPYEQSHNVAIAEHIDAAEHSLDIAMYSWSDARIGEALADAVARGVTVRMIFEGANSDRKKTGSSLEFSKSARLERMGIDVRYVNKIMHHKFVIIDGPRDDLGRAETAVVATGSGNWSNGAATRYDENTIIYRGYAELTLRLQREFNRLWRHSRDFVWDDGFAFEPPALAIDDRDIQDHPGTDAWFTSPNFSARGDTFRIAGRNALASELVAAIAGARRSIWIASGHLRSRPVSEALLAKRAADPDVDIRVYLDGQEYISEYYDGFQRRRLDDCLAEARTESQRNRCLDRGFYFGFALGRAGIDVRYKYYAYRWHFSYARQMHHKYLLIDGDTLFTGSYNLSDNAEHNTFENMLVFTGPEFSPLLRAFRDNFLSIWETGRAASSLATLTNTVETAASIPLVFDSMALTWQEVAALKAAIRRNCPQVGEEPMRTEPENHFVCDRL